MTAVFPIHPYDHWQLIRIRRYLIGFRRTNGWNQKQMSQRFNGTEGSGWDLEYNKTFQWRFSRLQDWVAGFGLRLDAQLRFPEDFGLEQRVQEHPEVAPFLGLAATAGNWQSWQRMALSSALTVARKDQGISTEELAQTLGVSRNAIKHWEALASDFMLPKALHHARALGGFISLGLVEKGPDEDGQ